MSADEIHGVSTGRRLRLRLLALLALLLSCLAPCAGHADPLRIAVASNFRLAMEELGTGFEAATGHEVSLSFGSTGKHYAQIINGAPYDAFFAADAERPARLEREGRIVPGSRFTYAIGRLVLWSPDPALVDARGAVLASDRFRHLAVANPDLAPYGAAAREVLLGLGLWERVEPRLVRGENIGQAFQFVVSGNAELGFVARSQLAAPGREFTGSSWLPPQALYPPIEQQAVLLRDGATARALLDYVRSAAAADVLHAHGYELP